MWLSPVPNMIALTVNTAVNLHLCLCALTDHLISPRSRCFVEIFILTSNVAIPGGQADYFPLCASDVGPDRYMFWFSAE